MVKSDQSCDYNEIMRRYCQCIAVRWGGQVASIQGIEGGSLLLLQLELAVKKRAVWIKSFLLEKDEERENRRMVPRYDGIHRD